MKWEGDAEHSEEYLKFLIKSVKGNGHFEDGLKLEDNIKMDLKNVSV
jgi:hypothetical protein